MIDLIKNELQEYDIPSNFKNLGNTVSSSIPILLKENNFKKQNKFIMWLWSWFVDFYRIY